ncbi:thioredoxin [Paenibacillus cremeus]|uniref:Thioredoxin n=1 Tax=Paenibacillus cremeus TaxID=2163881 RepID=A0A559KH78_9BACL|nr:thioredoxin [Paenibacillus cremeus]TVY11482.1 thioredoxin [Paenibacillus cremeus]
MSIRQVSETDFSSAIHAKKLVLVEFGAPWCPPCNTLLPILEKLEPELKGAVSIVKVNADDCPDIAAQYGILSMPTVILFKSGQPVDKLVGLRPKDVYKNLVAKHL